MGECRAGSGRVGAGVAGWVGQGGDDWGGRPVGAGWVGRWAGMGLLQRTFIQPDMEYVRVELQSKELEHAPVGSE